MNGVQVMAVPVTALQVTAVTNFLLASLAFYLAGALAARPAQAGSAAWYWRGAMFCLALAALLGGIDHGFVEPAGLPRAPLQRATWVVLGLMTLAALLTLAAQFLAARLQRLLRWLSLPLLLVYLLAVLLADSYLVVVLSYLPVILALLVFDVANLRNGSGHWTLAVGIGLLLLGSAVQALGCDSLSPLDHNGLYHLVSMAAVVFLYLGGRHLKTQAG